MTRTNENNRQPSGGGTRKMRERLWRYGPVVLWTAVILFASTNSMSASNTSRFVRPLLLLLSPDMSEQGLAFAHFIVRKCAHFTEYAVLALLAARAFLTSSHSALNHNWFLTAFCLVVLCSLTDEGHQSFVPTRTGAIGDILIDIAGGATALSALAVLRVWWRVKPRSAHHQLAHDRDKQLSPKWRP